MTGEQLRTTYSHRIESFEGSRRKLTRILNYLSLGRLISLIAAVWCLVSGMRHHSVLLYVACLLAVVLFLILVNYYARTRHRRELVKELRSLNETECSCLEHDYLDLPDGSDFSDPGHPWSHDLDLFGKGSLYQYINRTSTLEGGRRLSQFLTEEPVQPEEIIQRQELLDELKPELDFRQDFVARGRLLKEKKGDMEDLTLWASNRAYLMQQRWLLYLALGVSALAAGIIVAGFMNPSNFKFLLPLVVFNFCILSPYVLRNNRYHSAISRKHELLEGYAALLFLMAGQRSVHPELEGAVRKAGEGTREIRRLSRLLGIFDQRLNMLLGVLFNGLFLFDFTMIWLLERWKEKNKQQILDWINLTGWCDAVISLAGFAYNHQGFCLPVLESGRTGFSVKDLGHPLIPDSRRVDNNLELEREKVVIITGANMAGKSTFLRSLGVNLVLAYCGCPVCAHSFTGPFMGLSSSMRTADSLKDDESYFLAEIRKLQRIVRRMEKGEFLMILLDEVLKGTNTTDKRKGSVGLIRQAIKYPVLCFIATHDLSLGQMEGEHPARVVNYCFESYIKDVELTFDYTIKKGIATNMNASFLMKKMGIME